MKTGAWHIHCFDVPTDIDIQDSLMVDGFMAMPVIIAMCTYILAAKFNDEKDHSFARYTVLGVARCKLRN